MELGFELYLGRVGYLQIPRFPMFKYSIRMGGWLHGTGTKLRIDDGKDMKRGDQNASGAD